MTATSSPDLDAATDALFTAQAGTVTHSRQCCEHRVMDVAEADYGNDYVSTTAFLAERAGYDIDAMCNGDCSA